MVAKTRFIPGWMQRIIILKSRGFSDQECRNAANLTEDQLRRHLADNPEFAQDYEDAGNATPPKLCSW